MEFSGIQGSLKPENAERTREKKKKKTQSIMIKGMPCRKRPDVLCEERESVDRWSVPGGGTAWQWKSKYK